MAQWCWHFRSNSGACPPGKRNVFPSFLGADTCWKLQHTRENIFGIFTDFRPRCNVLNHCVHTWVSQLSSSNTDQAANEICLLALQDRVCLIEWGGGHELEPLRENDNKHYNICVCVMNKECEHHGLTFCAKLFFLELHRAYIFQGFRTAMLKNPNPTLLCCFHRSAV